MRGAEEACSSNQVVGLRPSWTSGQSRPCSAHSPGTSRSLGRACIPRRKANDAVSGLEAFFPSPDQFSVEATQRRPRAGHKEGGLIKHARSRRAIVASRAVKHRADLMPPYRRSPAGRVRKQLDAASIAAELTLLSRRLVKVMAGLGRSNSLHRGNDATALQIAAHTPCRLVLVQKPKLWQRAMGERATCYHHPSDRGAERRRLGA